MGGADVEARAAKRDSAQSGHRSAPDGGRRCRLPNPSKQSSPQEPIEALFDFAQRQQKQQELAVEELRRDSEALAAVFAAQQTIASAGFTLDEALNYLAQQALEITAASGAVLALSNGTEIVCRAHAGLLGPRLGTRLDPDSGISGAAFRSGEVLHCEDSENDPRVERAACQHLGIRSILIVPVRRQQETLGILEVLSGWAGAFGEREERVLKLLAAQVIQALRSEELRAVVGAEVPAAAAPTGQAIESAEVADAFLFRETPPMVVAAAAQDATVPPAVELQLFRDFAPPRSSPLLFRKYLGPAALMLAVVAGSVVAAWQWERIKPRAPAPTPVIPQAVEPPPASVDPIAVSYGPAQVTEVRYWSKPDLTSVAVFLDNVASYQSEALRAPDRIYFDLERTSVAPELIGDSKEGRIIEVNDALLQRIRIAHKEGGVTRIVLDLKGRYEYSSVISPTAPYRLMISIHAPRTGMAQPQAGGPASAAPSDLPPGAGRNAAAVYSSRRLKIAIDPGHGGSEQGAIGPHGTMEKDLVLEIARRLGDLLMTRLGADVVFTRLDDSFVPLESRTKMANQAQADLFVSIHANSSGDHSARGVETFFMDTASSAHELAVAARENAASRSGLQKASAALDIDMRDKIAESRKLALHVQRALHSTLAHDQGPLPNRGVKKAPFVVLTGANMPSVLAEVAFLSSPLDERALDSSQERDAVADALCRGIAGYLTSVGRGAASPRTAAWAGK